MNKTMKIKTETPDQELITGHLPQPKQKGNICDVLLKAEKHLSTEQSKKKNVLKGRSLKSEKLKAKKKHICEVCETECSTSGNLKIHMRNIHEGFRFPCEECGYQTGQKPNLMRHMLAMHGERRLECDLCDKTYKWDADLARHKLKHDNVKFECDQCEKEFREKRQLQTHKKAVHDKVVRRCSHEGCDFETLNINALHMHKKSVHEQVSYACDDCDYQTQRQGDMKRHSKEQHLANVFQCSLLINLNLSIIHVVQNVVQICGGYSLQTQKGVRVLVTLEYVPEIFTA